MQHGAAGATERRRQRVARATSRPRVERVERTADGFGIAADELARRAAVNKYGVLTGAGLQAWLLSEQLATLTADGLLCPAPRTVALVQALS